jgi:hypothetical protein
MNRLLTKADKVAAFRVATAGFARRIEERGLIPMDDLALEATLHNALGSFAGRCGPDQMHITWQGAGLKIWASWHIHNHVTERPIFAGQATVAMSREIYGIPDPAQTQLSLF